MNTSDIKQVMSGDVSRVELEQGEPDHKERLGLVEPIQGAQDKHGTEQGQ